MSRRVLEKWIVFDGHVGIIRNVVLPLGGGIVSLVVLWFTLISIRLSTGWRMEPDAVSMLILTFSLVFSLAILILLIKRTAALTSSSEIDSKTGIVAIAALYLVLSGFLILAVLFAGSGLFPGISRRPLFISEQEQSSVSWLIGLLATTWLAIAPAASAYNSLKERDERGPPRLTPERLLSVSASALESLRASLHDTRPDAWERMTVEEGLVGRIENESLTFLLGRSGVGKSSIAYRVASRWLESQNPVIWVGPDQLHNRSTLAEAIRHRIKEEGGNFEGHAGSKALSLASTERPLLIVVDDILDSRNPHRALEKVQSWRSALEPNQEAASTVETEVSILCPIRRTLWNEHQERTGSQLDGRIEEVTGLSREEGVRAIESVLDDHQVEYVSNYPGEVAEAVDDDPLLIGLLDTIVESDNAAPAVGELQGSVIERFTDSAVQRCRARQVDSFLALEYRDALRRIARFILEQKELRPLWTGLEDSLSNSHAVAVRHLISQGVVVRVNEGRIQFRHDRVRDWVLADVIGDELTSDDPRISKDDIFDPFFLDIHGLTVAINPLEGEIRRHVDNERPEALFETLRLLSQADPPGEVLESLRTWVGADPEEMVQHPAMEYVAGRLLETRHEAILDLSEDLPDWWSIRLARFKNGDVEAGIREAAHYGLRLKSAQLDDAAKEALNFYGASIEHQLTGILENPGVEDGARRGSMSLACYLGLDALAVSILEGWQLSDDREGLLPYALAGILLSDPSDLSDLIDPLMDFWETLPDEAQEEGHRSPRNAVGVDLRHALAQEVSHHAVGCLVEAGQERNLEWEVLLALSWVDDPRAVDFVVSVLAENSRGGDSPQAATWGFGSVTDHWQVHSGLRGRELSSESRSHLESIWTDPDQGDWKRAHAFNVWCGSVAENELENLRRVPDDSLLSNRALRERARLGDMEVVEDLLDALEDYPFRPNYLHKVWCPEAKDWVRRKLATRGQETAEDSVDQSDYDWFLADLLRLIPAEDAEELLTENWSDLHESSLFVQSALYVGTEGLQLLVEESVNEVSDPSELFVLTATRFGVDTVGLKERLTPNHFHRLTPYLQHIDGFQLQRIARRALELGEESWVREDVCPALPDDRRKEICPEIGELIDEIEEWQENRDGTLWVKSYCEDAKEQRIIDFPLLDAFEEWARQRSNLQALLTFAEAIRWHGQRDDIARLTRLDDQFPEQHFEDILERTAYKVRQARLD